MNRVLPERPGPPVPGWLRGLVVGTVAAMVTTVFLFQWGAPPQGDPSPYPSVTRNAPGA